MFATRFLRSQHKRSTGLVGLAVDPNSRATLIDLYNHTLEKIQMYDSSVEYRKSVEAITNYRLKVVKGSEDLNEIEEEIDCGQMEELIEQAKDELILMDLFINTPDGQPSKE